MQMRLVETSSLSVGAHPLLGQIAPMPEQPKETWEVIADELSKTDRVLQGLASQTETQQVNKALLQQVIRLSSLIGTLNAKLKPK